MSRLCRECVLGSRCRGKVNGVGPTSAEIMCVGQAPGRYEDRLGVPFVGDAGQFLSNCLDRIGLDSKRVYFTNVVKCFPGRKSTGDAQPPTFAIRACWPYLEEEFATVKPKLILAIGAVSMSTLGISGGIRKNSGKLFTTDYGLVIPVFHPAGLMRRLDDTPKFTTQLLAIETCLGGGPSLPPFKEVLWKVW